MASPRRRYSPYRAAGREWVWAFGGATANLTARPARITRRGENAGWRTVNGQASLSAEGPAIMSDDAIAECERKLDNARRDLAAYQKRRDPQAAHAAILVKGYECDLAELHRKSAKGQP